jgi:hypothetical protein
MDDAHLDANRPLLGEKTKGLCGRLLGVGKTAPRLLVAAVRNFPSVQVDGRGCACWARGRSRGMRRMTTGGLVFAWRRGVCALLRNEHSGGSGGHLRPNNVLGRRNMGLCLLRL